MSDQREAGQCDVCKRDRDDGVSLHPWYGPCDRLAGGECAECENAAALPT